MRYLNEDQLRRFEAKFYIDATTGCWEWTAAKRNGYGAVRLNGNIECAHRVSIKHYRNVEIIPPLVSCHECGNRSCVNPWHIRIDTEVSNQADRFKHGTEMIGSGHVWAKLTEPDVIEIRQALERGVPGKELAEIYEVSKSRISEIKHGNSWKHVKID